MGKVDKRVLNSIWRYSPIRLFALLGKAHPKWWYETDLVDFDSKWVFSFRPDGESRKTRFQLNLTIFVNSALCAAWKSPPIMVVWNRPRGTRSQGCFFVSPRWGKLKKAFWTQFDDIRQFGFLRCLEKFTQNGGMKQTSWISIPMVFFRLPRWVKSKNACELNLMIFVNSAFCAAWKRPPKILVINRPRGIRFQGCFFVSRRRGKSKKAFWTQFDDIRQFGFLRCLEKFTQNGGMKQTSWISIPRVFFRLPRWEKSKNAFWTQFDDIRQFGFFCCLKKPTQSGGMKPTSWNSIPRVFFRFAPMGKVEKRVLNSTWRYSSLRLFALLGKAHPKWWYKTDLVDFDPKGVFSFRPDGESRKPRFELNLTEFVNRLFALLGKAHPKWWYETDLVEFDPKGVFLFRNEGESRKTRFELNLAIFVNSAFCAAWKSPPKMVVWNRPR